MPRKKTSDKNLKRRLRESQGGALPPDLQTYVEWLTGVRNIEIDNPAPDGAKDLFAVYLLPFGRDYEAAGINTRLITGASGYGMSMWFGSNARVNPPNANNLLGHDVTDPERAAAVAMDGFYPALCRVTLTRGTGGPVTRTSAKTGRQYEQVLTRTSQMPFGRNTTTPEEDYLERKEAIAQALNELETPPKSYGFEGEVFRETPVPEVEFNPANNSVPID